MRVHVLQSVRLTFFIREEISTLSRQASFRRVNSSSTDNRYSVINPYTHTFETVYIVKSLTLKKTCLLIIWFGIISPMLTRGAFI